MRTACMYYVGFQTCILLAFRMSQAPHIAIVSDTSNIPQNYIGKYSGPTVDDPLSRRDLNVSVTRTSQGVVSDGSWLPL